MSRMIAWLLDDLFQVPGTKYRIGLDPFIALIPGLGDASASAIGTLILLQAFQKGVSKVVIARMALNILINAILGAIPGIGNFFSALFKSNRRNFALLQKYAAQPRRSTTGDWVFLIGLLVVVVAVIIGMAVLSAYLLIQFFHLLAPRA